MKITDEMVEAGWAKVVGDDIAHMTHQASFSRLDLADAIAAVVPLITQEAAKEIEIAQRHFEDRGRIIEAQAKEIAELRAENAQLREELADTESAWEAHVKVISKANS